MTLHRYPLQLCYTPASAPQYPTVAHLLSSHASTRLAASVARYVGIAHAHGMPIRIDEMNTNSCGRAPQVTEGFASAPWRSMLCSRRRAPASTGVNIHTYNRSSYRLFAFARTEEQWRAQVEPEYYGLLVFAEAAPPRSQLPRLYGPARRAAGQSFGTSTATGQPTGREQLYAVSPTSGDYVVKVPPASAALLVR